jgi:hypothetical protein
MKRLLSLALFPLLLLALTIPTTQAQGKKKDPRANLQPFNEYIGSWDGDGKAKKDSWAETLEWGWKFKGDDAWLVFKVKNGKFLKSGDLKFLPAKETYELTAVDLKDEKIVLEGKVDEKGYLTLLGTDPKTKEQLRMQMFNAGDGVFFNYRLGHAKPGSKFFVEDYAVKSKKVGEVFKSGSKQPECVVSGGLGTIGVTYMGKNYFVCCSGCRDAFAANAEKYVKEFEAKKKGK